MKTSKRRPLLKKIVRELQRHIDRKEGWSNGNPKTNGEYWLLSRVAPLANVMVDVGANIGDWTLECMGINPDVEVVAFEASPDTAKTFLKRFPDNRHVHLLNYGLGATQDILIFHDYGENSGLSGFFSRENSTGRVPERTIEIPIKRLDQVSELANYDFLDFVKIDTEGAEMSILRGSSGWLEQKKIKLLQFEYGGTWIDAREFLADAFSLLTGYGYLFGRLQKQGIFWIDTFDHRELETFKYANFIACSSADEASRLGLRS